MTVSAELPNKLTVYQIAMDGREGPEASYIRLKNPSQSPFPEAFTLCYRALYAFDDLEIYLPSNDGGVWLSFYPYFSDKVMYFYGQTASSGFFDFGDGIVHIFLFNDHSLIFYFY